MPRSHLRPEISESPKALEPQDSSFSLAAFLSPIFSSRHDALSAIPDLS